eukprot:1158412-Pelagomonas_calceolata.AAC.3
MLGRTKIVSTAKPAPGPCFHVSKAPQKRSNRLQHLLKEHGLLLSILIQRMARNLIHPLFSVSTPYLNSWEPGD